MSESQQVNQVKQVKQVKNACWNYLHESKVNDLGSLSEIVTVNENLSLDEAIKVLNTNHILSAPVLNDSGSLVGILDMLDVANHVIKIYPAESELEAHNMATLKTASRAMALKDVKSVIESSGRDPLAPLNFHDPTTLAVELFASGIHRCPIVDNDNNIVGILTQSRVLSHLHDQLPRGNLKVLGNKNLEELGLGLSKPISANLTDQVIDVVRKLDQNAISAVALMDENNNLVGNFSIGDMKGLWDEELPSFRTSVEDYLNKFHPESLSVVTLNVSNTTLSEVIDTMLESNIHRVWTYKVEKGVRTPCGIVSMTDLLKFVQNYQENF